MKHMIDYLYEYQERLVSPIWGGEKVFDFLCLSHASIAEALGFETYQATPLLRSVKEDLIVTEADLDHWIHSHRFDYSVFTNELKKLKQKIPNKKGLMGGGCFGPLTIVSGILGAQRMLSLTVKNPRLIMKFVEQVTEYLIELTKAEEKEGAQFIWIAEPLASLLAPESFWKLSGLYLQKLFLSLRVPGFLHVCGRTLYHTDYLIKTGAEVLSIDSVTDIGQCIRLVNQDTIIMGNVSPAILRDGTPEESAEEVKKILNECRNYKNFVLSTGCSIMEGTPEENINQLFEITGQYPIWDNEDFRTIRKLIKLLETVSYAGFKKFADSQGIKADLENAALKEFELIKKARLTIESKGKAAPISHQPVSRIFPE